MNRNAKQFYIQEIDNYTVEYEHLTKKIKNYSRLRVFWFLFGVTGVYFTTLSTLFWVGIVALLFLFVFVFIVIQHTRFITQLKETEIYLNMFHKEQSALSADYSAFTTGDEFMDNHHSFASDLDLFGSASIFQMLNRNFSNAGKAFLATILKTLEKNANKILLRQDAVKELSNNPNWLFKFRALGLLAFTKESSFSPDPNYLAENLPIWIKRKSIFSNQSFRYAQFIIPILSFVVFVFLLFGTISSSVFILYMFVTLGFTGFYTKQINKQHQELSKQSDTLFRFQNLINHIEKTEFKSIALNEIQNKFLCKDDKASIALKKLGQIIQAFDTRLNIFAWLILNYFLLWDIRQSIRLEQWKKTYQNLPSNIFNAIAEIEMIVSFSTFNYNREDLIFPEIETNGFIIEGKSIGHPLMKAKSRVDNDVFFPSTSQFSVITGANMAGKSTYLRTVGVNLILALSGAPVCAKQFKTCILQPFTSIKTSDSLSNNESYFYAELLRLQRIIEALKTGESFFIILDEILKGTNSKDKEQGSKALVKKLIGLNASGIIATHDLQLAELSKIFPENVKTACFEVEIENDQLVFDYKLRNGVSQNLNATFLMEKMGIS